MLKFSDTNKFIAILITIAALVLAVYLDVTTSDLHVERVLQGHMERHQEVIEELALHSNLFLFTEDVKHVEALAQSEKHLNELLYLLKEGGSLDFHGKVYDLSAVKDPFLVLQVNSFFNLFHQHQIQIKKLTGKNIYIANSSLDWNDPSSKKKVLNPQVKDAVIYLDHNNIALKKKYILVLEAYQEYLDSVRERKNWTFSMLTTVILLLTVGGIYLFYNSFSAPLKKLEVLICKIAERSEHSVHISDPIQSIGKSVYKLSKLIRLTIQAVENIQTDGYQEVIDQIDHSLLKASMISVHDKLLMVSKDEQKRTWTVEGASLLGEILRLEQQQGIEVLTQSFLEKLIEYTEANQGGVYLIDEEVDEIKMIACYAYGKRKYIKDSFSYDHGLVGQCIQEQKYVYMEKVPESYIKITSGLGESLPRSVITIPIRDESKIIGALELAFFKKLDQFVIDFLEDNIQRLGSTVSFVLMSNKTSNFLNQAMRANEELVSKEQELSHQTEEMRQVQADLDNQVKGLVKEKESLETVMDALNANLAVAIFNIRGELREANNYFQVLSGQLGIHLTGKRLEELFEMTSALERAWDNTLSGAVVHETCVLRLTEENSVYLQATFHPVLNMEEDLPSKIIIFFNQLSPKRERSIIDAQINDIIGVHYPLIEVDYRGVILSINKSFRGHIHSDIKEGSSLFSYIVSGDAVVWKQKWARIQKNKPEVLRLMLPSSDGVERQLACIFYPLYKQPGKINRILVLLDV